MDSLSSTLWPLLLLQTWQVSLLFLVVFVFSWFWGQRCPHFTLVLWIVFLIKCATPPLLTSPVSVLGFLTPDAISTVSKSTEKPSVAEERWGTAFAERSAGFDASLHPDSAFAVKQHSAPPRARMDWLTFVWLLGCSGYLFLSLSTYVSLQFRLKSLGDWCADAPAQRPNAQTLQEVLDRYNAKMTGCRPARLKITHLNTPPFSGGLFFPTIVIPEKLLELDSHHESVLAHELCHLWRRDQLIGWLQMLVQALFWFHPFVWIANKRLNYWCELCCDDDTIRMFRLPKTEYAHGLLDVVTAGLATKSANWIPSVNPAALTQNRILAILEKSGKDHYRNNHVPWIFILLLLCLPATGSFELANMASAELNADATAPFKPPQFGSASQLNFLVGTWQVLYDGRAVATSRFHYEKSGRILRESWTSVSGSTAQGITYYDPAENVWKMTFGSSDGSLVEVAGNLVSTEFPAILEMRGKTTFENGEVQETEMHFVFESGFEFELVLLTRQKMGRMSESSRMQYLKTNR